VSVKSSTVVIVVVVAVDVFYMYVRVLAINPHLPPDFLLAPTVGRVFPNTLISSFTWATICPRGGERRRGDQKKKN
jgi:hypothetical protein